MGLYHHEHIISFPHGRLKQKQLKVEGKDIQETKALVLGFWLAGKAFKKEGGTDKAFQIIIPGLLPLIKLYRQLQYSGTDSGAQDLNQTLFLLQQQMYIF